MMTIEELKSRALNGDVYAMKQLGKYYMEQKEGSGIEEAEKWFEMAADKGDASSVHCAYLCKSINVDAGMIVADKVEGGVYFVKKDIEDLLNWIMKDYQCAVKGLPGTQNIDKKELLEDYKNRSYELALLSYMTQDYNQVAKLTADMTDTKGIILKALSGILLSEDLYDQEMNLDMLRVIENNSQYGNAPKIKFEENIYANALLMLANRFRNGLVSIRKETPDVNRAQRLLANSINYFHNEKLQGVISEELEKYQKDINGNFSYADVKKKTSDVQVSSTLQKSSGDSPSKKTKSGVPIFLGIAAVLILLFIATSNSGSKSGNTDYEDDNYIENDDDYDMDQDESDDMTDEYDDNDMNSDIDSNDTIDYSDMLDLTNYEYVDTVYYSFYAPIKLYDVRDTDSSSGKCYYYSSGNEEDSLTLSVRPYGKYEYSFETADELLDILCDTIVSSEDDVLLKTYQSDADDGIGRLVFKDSTYSEYCAYSFYDDAVYAMELSYRYPESEEEEKWIDYYINVLYRGCSFTRDVGEIYTYEEYLSENGY